MFGRTDWTPGIRLLALSIFALALIMGVGMAVQRYRHGGAEWRHWRAFVLEPMDEVVGPEKHLFGYFPGAKALLVPFVRTGHAGFAVFALLNVVSCIGALSLLDARIPRGAGPPRCDVARPWLLLCGSVPSYLAIQNNQIIAPAVFLALLAFALLQHRWRALSGCVLAAAALMKTLPAALFLLLLLMRSWRTFLAAALSLALLTLGLSAMTEGVAGSIRHHRAWPGQILAQNPSVSEDEDGQPGSMAKNQSPSAEIARLAELTGTRLWVWLHRAVLLAATALLAAACLPASDNAASFWHKVAAWMAWIPYAAPFGRYYYLLFQVPAWYILGLRVLEAPNAGRKRLWLLPLPLVAAAAKNYTGVNAVIVSVTFFAILALLAAEGRAIVRKGAKHDPLGARGTAEP